MLSSPRKNNVVCDFLSDSHQNNPPELLLLALLQIPVERHAFVSVKTRILSMRAVRMPS